MRTLMIAGIVSLQAAAAAFADEPVSLTVKKLFKEHGPFIRAAERVEYINSIKIACGIDNQRLRDAQQEAFADGKAEIGEDAMRDQIYLLGMRQANMLMPAGAHEQFCHDAKAYWGDDDRALWNAPLPGER